MIKIPMSVAALIAAATSFAVLGGYVMVVMIGQVNRKLPDDQQISYLWGHYAKYQRVLEDYKRLYPSGHLDAAFVLMVALMFVSLVATMLVMVYMGPF